MGTCRRFGLSLLVAALIAIGAGSSLSATSTPIRVSGGVSQPVFSYADAIRETVYVRSTEDGDLDGSLDLIATDIIRPKETSHGLEVPVIYEMSPYYQVLGRGNEAETKPMEDGDFVPTKFPLFYDNYFVPRGYAVVLQDMRGTRNSEGCMVLGGREEIADAEATIAWLNGRGAAFTAQGEPVTASWSSGKVGMIGKSYDGTIANAAASVGIAGLTTIVPIAAISRWYDYLLDAGVQQNNVALTPALFTLAIDQTPGDDEERRAAWVRATAGREGPCTAIGAAVMAGAADPRADYGPFFDDRDYRKDAARVKASVFLIHGLGDNNVETKHFSAWWEALAARDVPRKIWLARAGHVDPFDFRRAEWVRTLHRWFDFWLQGIPNGIMEEPEADVEVAPGVWQQAASWPLPETEGVIFYLTAGTDGPGSLSASPAGGGNAAFTDNPLGSEGSMYSEETVARPSRLVFRTPPLPRDVRLSGRTQVSIEASVNRPDTDLTALLVDYAEGDSVTVVDPEVATTDRSSCHGESSESDDACYFETEYVVEEAPAAIVSKGYLDARHRESLREGSLLETGRTYAFAWEIWGNDHIFKKGHRIGLVLAGSDTNYNLPDPWGATVTVSFGSSRVTLPIVGGSAAFDTGTTKPSGGGTTPRPKPRPRAPAGRLPATGVPGAWGVLLVLVSAAAMRRLSTRQGYGL